MNLGPWGYHLNEHLKEFKPKMYAELKRMGKLESHLKTEESRIAVKHSQLLDDGLHEDQISELLMEDLYPAGENPNSL